MASEIALRLRNLPFRRLAQVPTVDEAASALEFIEDALGDIRLDALPERYREPVEEAWKRARWGRPDPGPKVEGEDA